MSYAIYRLKEGDRATLLAHLLALPPTDRRLRFCAPLAPEAIAAYVDRIDFRADAVFGVHDDRLVLVGAAHLAFEDEVAELALSVLPTHRRLGIGTALFQRALAHASSQRAAKLMMHCLSGNVPIMRIAEKFGMDIIAGAGEVDAHVEVPPFSLASMAAQFASRGARATIL